MTIINTRLGRFEFGNPSGTLGLLVASIALVCRHPLQIVLFGVLPALVVDIITQYTSHAGGAIVVILTAVVSVALSIYITGAQLLLLNQLANSERREAWRSYTKSWFRLKQAPFAFTLGVVGATPELIFPMCFRTIRRYTCSHVLSVPECQTNAPMARVCLWLMCIEFFMAGWLTLLILMLLDEIGDRTSMRLEISVMWTSILELCHYVVLGGVVLMFMPLLPTMPERQTRERRIWRWMNYVALLCVVIVVLNVISVVKAEIERPYSILPPRHASKKAATLEANGAPFIFIGPTWIHVEIPESGVYLIAGRAWKDSRCRLWLLGGPVEQASDTCPVQIEALLPKGEYDLFASLDQFERMRLSLSKVKLESQVTDVLWPDGKAALDTRAFGWQLVRLRIQDPGTYSVLAERVEGAYLHIELAQEGFVTKNDSLQNQSSELIASLKQGDHLLAVKVWPGGGIVEVRLDKTAGNR